MTNRPFVAIVAILVLVTLVLGLVIGLSFQVTGVPVNTTTQSYENAGWRGRGQFRGDGSNNPGSELLNDDEYIASWSPELNGQTATAALHMTDVFFGCNIDSIRYDWYKNSGAGWGAPVHSTTVQPGIGFAKEADMPATTYTIMGLIQGGGLAVISLAHCAFGDWVPMARDEAHVFSGIGSVTWGKRQYTSGETASVTARVGYVSDDATGRGWFVTIFSTAQNRVVVSERIAQTVQRFDYQVTTADFSTKSGCRNELVAILTNELWDKDFETATVIDVTGAGPKVSNIDYQPRMLNLGENVRITWSSAPNSQTQLPLEKHVVKYGFGGIDKEVELPATDREYIIRLTSVGTLHVEVIAYDTGCRPSEPAALDIRVSQEPIGIAGLSILAIVAILASVAAGATLARFVKVGFLGRIILFVAPVIVVLTFILAGVI